MVPKDFQLNISLAPFHISIGRPVIKGINWNRLRVYDPLYPPCCESKVVDKEGSSVPTAQMVDKDLLSSTCVRLNFCHPKKSFHIFLSVHFWRSLTGLCAELLRPSFCLARLTVRLRLFLPRLLSGHLSSLFVSSKQVEMNRNH